ncbi:MAG: hypothetical protein KC983_02330, partial [Phycisphaerales bacterium]|nr:hypothetical protein [Phycisphaerales bacterium]
MMNGKSLALLGAAATFAFAGVSNAANITVSSDVSVSTTWTADNVYNLDGQIYVLPGATLTIEPGTIVATTATANGSGSLAITRGAKINAKGTFDAPIIFTSSNDDFVNWREAANEWGNITIMGRGYIANGVGSPNFIPGNTSTCGNNVADMEGLTPDFANDPNVRYGGTDDDDDSGCLEYVSIRYGGRVIGLGDELNGLSLGGIGRGTDINHIEIMNNVDDGIEIWGGTVNLKYVSIWNIGDDSFDVDQGWRGKAQFGLIVQGYSLDASQGSGVGDNCIETDGAEDSDSQPVTTAAIYNFTVIGQPAPGAGDGGTAWRANARVQYRQCIFMDLGERLVRFDDLDGDGSQGYGFNGTLSWPATWTTPYTATSTVNPCSNPAARYTAQSAGNAPGQGFLAEITDSVFFRNLASDAYTESDARGVTVAGGSNPAKANVVPAVDFGNIDANMPIVSLGRAAPVTKGGKTMLRVISIDPRAANDAVSSVGSPPAGDDFFSAADYRGGFGPNENWICGWTAAEQYGFVVAPPGGCVAPANPCPWDCAPDGGNGSVNIDDLLRVINEFGTASTACDNAPDNGDGTFGNGTINIDDLLGVINNF